jgi:cytochrome c oxidase cbb3-type subunit 3/ubiquinol-cytochrome c reductase cytochrome c subunit
MQEGKSFTLVDARVIPDYLYGHISGAVAAPFDQIERAAEVLTRDRWVITYCGCPHAVSGRARTALKRAGFERVAVLDEGYYYWTDQMYPNCGGRERYCD